MSPLFWAERSFRVGRWERVWGSVFSYNARVSAEVALAEEEGEGAEEGLAEEGRAEGEEAVEVEVERREEEE